MSDHVIEDFLLNTSKEEMEKKVEESQKKIRNNEIQLSKSKHGYFSVDNRAGYVRDDEGKTFVKLFNAAVQHEISNCKILQYVIDIDEAV
jgi:hypothetical protein